MRKRTARWPLSRIVLVLMLLFVSACSAQEKRSQDDFLADTSDPFKDSFFADAPQWDQSVLKQSEIPMQDTAQDAAKEPEEPQSFVERSEQVAFATLIVGGTLAKMFLLPMLGF